MSKKTFESAMLRLQEIVTELEGGGLGLEASLKVYEEGMELIKFCSSKLQDAEKRVKTLSKTKSDTK